MASVNKVILVGNLGRDPEVRYLPDGAAVANASLATASTWKDKVSGERKEETEWHRLVVYGRLAEILGEYGKKGRSVYVEGRLKTRKWQDKEGQERYTTEIVIDQLQLLGGRDGASSASSDGGEFSESSASSSRGESSRGSSAGASGSAPKALVDMDDDIPF